MTKKQKTKIQIMTDYLKKHPDENSYDDYLKWSGESTKTISKSVYAERRSRAKRILSSTKAPVSKNIVLSPAYSEPKPINEPAPKAAAPSTKFITYEVIISRKVENTDPTLMQFIQERTENSELITITTSEGIKYFEIRRRV